MVQTLSLLHMLSNKFTNLKIRSLWHSHCHYCAGFHKKTQPISKLEVYDTATVIVECVYQKTSPILKLEVYGTATVCITHVFTKKLHQSLNQMPMVQPLPLSHSFLQKKLNQCNAITGFQDQKFRETFFSQLIFNGLGYTFLRSHPLKKVSLLN